MLRTRLIKRLTAGLLTLVMIFSVGSVCVTTASAASLNSIDTKSIAKDIAKGYLKEIVDATAGSNPVTSVLGSVGLDLFDKMINGEEHKPASTDDILAELTKVSDKMDTYHKEEMGALARMEKKEDLIINKMDLSAFKEECDDMRAIYKNTLRRINNHSDDITDVSLTENTDDADIFIIDDSTYDAYGKILGELNPDCDVSESLSKMHSYLSGSSTAADNNECYLHLVDGYRTYIQAYVNTASSVDDVRDFEDISREIDGIEADITLYCACYLSTIQMEYQMANHDRYQSFLNDRKEGKDVTFTPVKMTSYLNEITYVNQTLTGYDNDEGVHIYGIDEKYNEAVDYYDSMVSAQVTMNPGMSGEITKTFSDTDIAWSVAQKTALSGHHAGFTLLKDWKYTDADGFNPNSSICSTGFTDNGLLSLDLTKGDIDICLNSHDIDMNGNFNYTILTVSGNHTLNIYGSTAEDSANLPRGKFAGGIYGGSSSIVFNATAGTRDRHAVLNIAGAKLYEPYYDLIAFSGSGQDQSTVTITHCFLNNTHSVYERGNDYHHIAFSNCTVNLSDLAVRTITKNDRAFQMNNVYQRVMNDIRYYGKNDFIIV